MRRTRQPSALDHPLARLVLAYYGATPLFIALDYLLGISVRVPFLDALPAVKAGYYGASVLCAGVIAFRPRHAALVAYAESATSIALLVLTTWTTYFQLVEATMSEDGVVANPFTEGAAASLAMSALVLGASHALNRERLRRRLEQ